MAEPDALVLRSDAMPFRARAATPQMLWSDSVSRMSPEGWAVAGSGDLGFVYGTVTSPAGGQHGYERIYRRTRSGWKIVVDLID